MAQLGKGYRDRYEIAFHALHHSVNKRRMITSQSAGPTRVLSQILSPVLGPGNGTFSHDLWLAALDVCDDLCEDDRGGDYIALLLVTLLRASKDLVTLWQKAYNSPKFTSFDPKTFLEKRNHVGLDEETVKLFEELERRVTQDSLQSTQIMTL